MIGDDWIIAALVAVTLTVLAIAHNGNLWWVLPIIVLAALGQSLWRVARSVH